MHRSWKLLAILIISIFIIVTIPACGDDSDETPTVTISPSPTSQPSPTLTVSPTPTVAPTITPTVQPTERPSPAPEPTIPTESEESKKLSGEIDGIDPTKPTSLATLFTADDAINKSVGDGDLTGDEAAKLEGDLKAKFGEWVRSRVDEIDPADADALKEFFDLQYVQRTSEYDRLADQTTKQYKHEQMGDKFNQWITNRVNEIDPNDPDSLKYFFWLQVVQATDKYDELITTDTHNYKEETMGTKFNEWILNRVSEIDTSDPSSLEDFYKLQTIQATEKYEKFATTETHGYKEQQLSDKFNEWIMNMVSNLDPDDPDFMEEVEKLRVMQLTDKYEKFATSVTHNSKEGELKTKFGQYVTGLADRITPSSATFMEDLNLLINLQNSDLYNELCPQAAKDEQVALVRDNLLDWPGDITKVQGVYPEYNQSGVSISQNIIIAFNQPMVTMSVEPEIWIAPALEYSLKWLYGNTVVVLELENPMNYDTRYTIDVIAAVLSIYDTNMAEDIRSIYTTASPGNSPQVIQILPVDGISNASTGSPMQITFDMPMDRESAEWAINVSPTIEYGVMWRDSDTIAVLQCLEPLAFDTEFTVTVDGTTQSVAGEEMGTGYTSSFFTGIHGAPAVTGSIPVNGQTAIPLDYPIQITFDRSMDPDSVESLLTVSPGFEYSTAWYDANFVLQINSSTPLDLNQSYSITIGAEAESAFGQPLGEDYTFSFTTLIP